MENVAFDGNGNVTIGDYTYSGIYPTSLSFGEDKIVSNCCEEKLTTIVIVRVNCGGLPPVRSAEFLERLERQQQKTFKNLPKTHALIYLPSDKDVQETRIEVIKL